MKILEESLKTFIRAACNSKAYIKNANNVKAKGKTQKVLGRTALPRLRIKECIKTLNHAAWNSKFNAFVLIITAYPKKANNVKAKGKTQKVLGRRISLLRLRSWILTS